MPAHLLSLAALHAAAPGVLDVIFGADGDFEGAPRWVGPVLTPQGYRHSLRGVTISSRPDLPGGVLVNGIGDRVYLSADVALDLRIPSVAARIAGLCARALTFSGKVSAAIVQSWWSREGDGMEIVYAAENGSRRIIWFSDGTMLTSGCVQFDIPEDDMSTDPASFLASLCLALAPRIAALPASARSR